MTIRLHCKRCGHPLAKITRRGLSTCDVKCVACGHEFEVEKLRIKILERMPREEK